MMHSDTHIPVLKREVLAALSIKPGGTYLDATLGRGGHAAAICEALGAAGRLVALDRDPQAVAVGREKFANDARVTVLHGEFAEMDALLSDADLNIMFDGILMDLGVSSPQLDQAERGFSFMRDGALDMRMDPSQGISAAQWLANVDQHDLVKVLFEYGEEKFARRIARSIVQVREEAPITTTMQLAKIVEQAVPKKQQSKKHPATRTFQAIRIYINRELEQINDALPKAVRLLAEGGRLAVISFHSLEDRLVKRFIRHHSSAKLPPRQIPVSAADYLTPLTAIGKAIKPSQEETQQNPRARSSVLRVAQRTEQPFQQAVAHA